VYVLARERSVAEANRFLAAFAPRGRAAADEYESPEYSDQPTVVFSTATEAIQYCGAHPDAGHRFYFDGGDGPAHAMPFFTSDGGLILGLSILADAEQLFAQLKAHAGSEIGYITVEDPPCEPASEFRRSADDLLQQYRAAHDYHEYE